MKRDTSSPLLAKPIADSGMYQHITKEEGQWEFLNFAARTMKKGEQWTENTGDNEYAIIL